MGVSPKIGPYKLFIFKWLQVLNSLKLVFASPRSHMNADGDRHTTSIRLNCRYYPSPDPHFRGRELEKELKIVKKKHLNP